MFTTPQGRWPQVLFGEVERTYSSRIVGALRYRLDRTVWRRLLLNGSSVPAFIAAGIKTPAYAVCLMSRTSLPISL